MEVFHTGQSDSETNSYCNYWGIKTDGKKYFQFGQEFWRTPGELPENSRRTSGEVPEELPEGVPEKSCPSAMAIKNTSQTMNSW